MKKDFFISFFILCGTVSLLLGLQNRPPIPVKPSLIEEMTPFVQEGVAVSYKAYTSEESKTYLSRDLPSRGIQPIQITIQNNTSQSYTLDPDQVTLPSERPSKVAMKVTKSAIPRAIAYKVASFFFWPFFIPSTIDGIKTFRSHRALKKNFRVKSLKTETILPYSTLHRILFVAEKNYNADFSLSLLEEKSKKTLFFTSGNCG